MAMQAGTHVESGQPVVGAVASAGASARLRAALWVFVGGVIGSVALRALYLVQPWRVDWVAFRMFLGDEGTHGLMALHILRGARPVFYYGGYYLGALDAYLSALSFWMFGDSLASLRAIPTAFSLASIGVVYSIGGRMYSRQAGFLAAALVALPSHFVFEWGSTSICGFSGHVFLILVLLSIALALFDRVTTTRLLAFGLVAGIAAWNNQLAVGYIVMCALAIFLWVPVRRKEVALLLIAGIIGIAPLVYGNIIYPFSTVRGLGRKSLFAWTLAKKQVQVDEDEDEDREYRSLPLLEVLGAHPRRDGSWSVVGALGTVFLGLGFLGALRRSVRARSRAPNDFRRHALLVGCVIVSIGAGISGFSGQPVGRYQLPLYPLLAVLAVGWITREAPRLSVWIVGLLALAQGVSLAAAAPWDGSTPRAQIVKALKEKDLKYGYAAGQMYDLVFEARETVIFVPLDHSRYAPYEQQVAKADRIFYLYRTDHRTKDAHRAFMKFLEKAGIRYQQMEVGDYHVLYEFAPRDAISPQALATMQRDFRREKFGR